MPTVDAVVECPVYDSFRVRQVAGMFDVPLARRAAERFSVEVPGVDEPWTIGVIVGPSGSGKSTVARAAFGDDLYQPGAWPLDRAVIDGFGDAPIRELTSVLTSVGFSSPPSWVKPYAVLSNGEKFRCDLARAMVGNKRQSDEATEGQREGEERETHSSPLSLSRSVASSLISPVVVGSKRQGDEATERQREGEDSDSSSFPLSLRRSVPSSLIPPVVFDEFTSVVDRTVAKISSAAIAKAIRGGRIDRRFVAVTCHYDVVQWLEPDWVLDMADGTLARGLVRRPGIRLDVHRAPAALWGVFKRHHYLSATLHRSAACFAGFVDGSPATFTATLFFPHATRPGWREHRTVCLPDFQGVGLGNAMSEFVAGVYRATGRPYFSTTSHPAMIRHRCRSPLWRVTRKPATSTNPHAARGMAGAGSIGRLTASFEYVGPPRPADAVSLGVPAHPGGTKHGKTTH